MAKGIMVVRSRPSDPAREDEIYELDDLDALKAPRETTKSDVILVDSVMTYELLS